MFDPDEFWQLARSLLLQPTPSEGACRTAASRAYYAMFLVVRERLHLPLGGDAADHGRVLTELRRRNRQGLADALDTLRRLRTQADYELGASISKARVVDVMNNVDPRYQYAKRL